MATKLATWCVKIISRHIRYISQLYAYGFSNSGVFPQQLFQEVMLFLLVSVSNDADEINNFQVKNV